MPSWSWSPQCWKIIVYCKVLDFKLAEKNNLVSETTSWTWFRSMNTWMKTFREFTSIMCSNLTRQAANFLSILIKKNLQPGLSYLLFKHIIILNSLRVCCFYLVGDSMIYLMQLSAVQFCSKSHTESLILELTFSEIVVKSKYFFLGDYLQSITRTPWIVKGNNPLSLVWSKWGSPK